MRLNDFSGTMNRISQTRASYPIKWKKNETKQNGIQNESFLIEENAITKRKKIKF